MSEEIPSLTPMSMDELHRLVKRGDLRAPSFGRPDGWSAKEACAFLNASFHTMVFYPLMVSENYDHHQLDVVDGWRRLCAISGYHGIWYDFASSVFRESKSGSQSLKLVDIVSAGPQGCLDTLSSSPGGKTVSVLFESIRIFFHKWESRNVPLFKIHEEYESSFEIFDVRNSAGLPVRVPTCHCVRSSPRQLMSSIDTLTTGNTRIDESQSYVRPTDHSRFFDLNDVHCAVHHVDSDIINNLNRNDARTHAHIERLISLARNCAHQIGSDDDSQAASFRERIENDIDEVRQKWDRFAQTDCVSDQEVSDLESVLSTLSGWANECSARGEADRFRPLPTIPVRLDGCFLPEKKTVCGEEFLAGIYISDNPTTDPTELLYHELTHAYLHAHKQVHIDCPWIEEGLAELCGKLWRAAGTSGSPTLDRSAYSRFKPKPSLYYNFLEEVIKMNPQDIQELFQNYTGRNPTPKPNLNWCTDLIRPYCL